MVVQQLVILVSMQEKMSSCPSTSPSWENEVTNMLLEKNREMTPRRNEEAEPKQKQHPVLDVPDGESTV